MPYCLDCQQFFTKEDWLNLAHFKRQCLRCKAHQAMLLEPLKLPYKTAFLTVLEVPIDSAYHEKISFIKPFGVWLERLFTPHIPALSCALALHYHEVFYHHGSVSLDLLERIHHAETLSVYIIV